MKNFFIAAGISACLASTALAADGPSGEVLVVPAYPTGGPWKKTVLKDEAAMRWEESIPESEPENDIRNILTAQTEYALKGKKPVLPVIGMAELLKTRCENVRLDGPKEETENGYSVVYGILLCTNQKDAAKNVDIVVKVIAGQDALYVVQREFRYPLPPPDQPKLSDQSSSKFPAAQFTEAILRLRAIGAARDFLVSQVRLCPSAQSTSCLAKTPH